MKYHVSSDAKKYLQSIADLSGAKSYREWLSGKARSGADKKRQQAAGEVVPAPEERQGERLLATGLSGDGYAAYLEQERKNLLKTKVDTIEKERTEHDGQLADGYAAYLRDVKKERGEELVNGAATMLSLPVGSHKTAGQYADLFARNSEQKNALLREFAGGTRLAQSAFKMDEIIRRLLKENRGYQDAHDYCIAIGLPKQEAERVAEYCEKISREHQEYINQLIQGFLEKDAGQ